MGISTLDFNDFWHYLTKFLYSMKLKRVNDLLIVIELIKSEIVACARKVHRSYAFYESGQALNLSRKSIWKDRYISEL